MNYMAKHAVAIGEYCDDFDQLVDRIEAIYRFKILSSDILTDLHAIIKRFDEVCKSVVNYIPLLNSCPDQTSKKKCISDIEGLLNVIRYVGTHVDTINDILSAAVKMVREIQANG